MVLTKLLSPRPQVTLSQVPPSKKETWGAKGNPSFPARPRANQTGQKKKQRQEEIKELSVMWLVST